MDSINGHACLSGASGGACCGGACAGRQDDPASAKREICLLAGCAALFFGVMIFSDAILAAFGIWGLRLGYAVPYAVCGFSVFRSALASMASGRCLDEFTLMCGATVAAIALGELPEAVGVMLFYRIGEFFQERSAAGARRSVKSLLASRPSTAMVLENGLPVEKAVEAVRVGQRLQVAAGEKIPLDGVVVSGRSEVDQSPLTGESLPVSVENGSPVYGGALNLSGAIVVEATSLFADTHIARILNLVEHAAARKSPTERFITRFARVYTPAVVALACLTALLPPLLLPDANLRTWAYRALVMLVISCPCALVISIPLAYFAGIGAASRKGILIKGGSVLDGLLHVDTVVFDKTGTLTCGRLEVCGAVPAAGVSGQELLRAACLSESRSNHPAARSVMRHCAAQGIFPPPDGADETALIRELPGKGMEAVVGGIRYLAGAAALLNERGIACLSPSHPGTVIHVAKGDAYLGCLLISDSLKADAAASLAALAGRGLKSVMLTGDREESAAWVAAQAGIGEYRAGLLPEDKVNAMRELADGARAAFVGDGINDAPVLALSRVGIAMGGIGSEAAIEAADAVILNDSLTGVSRLFSIAAKVRVIVRQNIVLALGIKTAFMGFGVAGISGLWEAVFADVGVALLAVLNAARIMRE